MGDGKKLKEILDSKGTNVRQIAKATGISATTLYLQIFPLYPPQAFDNVPL